MVVHVLKLKFQVENQMHKLTLLYAEDDQETRENYAFVLKQYFHEVYTAKDGKEALTVYREKKPDVLLLDISMPLIDGLDVAKEVRRNNKVIPIIMLTAHSEHDRLMKAVNLQLEAYLIKPIDNLILKNTMLNLTVRMTNKDMVYLSNEFSWDKISSDLYYQEEHIKLTKKETLLVKHLGNKAGNYFSRDSLIISIWHDELPNESHDNKLIQLVYRVNAKTASYANTSIQLIQNSYALGYKLALT